MNFELDHDLTAWADGSLSREDLVTLHGQEARTLVALHERLVGAAEMAAPDPVAGWALLQQRLGAKVVPIRTRPRPRLRRAILAVAAALLIGGGAFAAIRGGAVDHPSVLSPPVGSPASDTGTHEQSPGQVGGSSGVTDDRSAGPNPSSSASASGSGDTSQGSTGSGGTTGDSGDGTASGGTDSGGGSGGSQTQDPDGQHPGQGNGGEDNGKDGLHGHGRAPTSSHA